MSIATPPPRHPTIVIGYGRFGREVLRQLLNQAGSRGVLSWEPPAPGRGPAERRLRGLSLLWLPDRLGIPEQQAAKVDHQVSRSFGIMNDLYRQIVTVGDAPDAESGLANAVMESAKQLLAADTRARNPGQLPFGLDVVVVASPTRDDVVGTLDQLLTPGMEQLANNPSLEARAQNAQRLNFIEILDFDNYLEQSERARRIRKAVNQSASEWQARATKRRPSFGRIYLVDGRSEAWREETQRADEIALFLELLLFENQRVNLQHIFQGRAEQSPVGTFGLRVMERSSGLLCRLAAARFAHGWLDHLAGNGSRPASDIFDRESELALDKLKSAPPIADRAELRARSGRELEQLEEELLAIPREEEWPASTEAAIEKNLPRLRRNIIAETQRIYSADIEASVAATPARVRERIELLLHRSEEPLSIGAVIDALNTAIAELQSEARPKMEPERHETHFGILREVYEKYSAEKAEQVHPSSLQSFWWLFVLIAAAGLTPALAELLRNLPVPDPLTTHNVLRKAHRALTWLAQPPGIGVLALITYAVLLGVCLGTIHRFVRSRVSIALGFFTHPTRGRMTFAVRQLLYGPQGIERALLRDATRARDDLLRRWRTDLAQELLRFVSRLEERRREMHWLQKQMRDYLKAHGIEESGDNTGVRADREGHIRRVIMGNQDFERILANNPPTPARFASEQSQQKPFKDWNEAYSDTFLHPLDFLERLSALYQTPLNLELRRAGEGPEQQRRLEELRTFLEDQPCQLALKWAPKKGVPEASKYCVMGESWRAQRETHRTLDHVGIPVERILDGPDESRVYTLMVQLGVAPEHLL